MILEIAGAGVLAGVAFGLWAGQPGRWAPFWGAVAIAGAGVVAAYWTVIQPGRIGPIGGVFTYPIITLGILGAPPFVGASLVAALISFVRRR